MVGIIYITIAFVKARCCFKKYRAHGNSWNGETLSKQGVALKKYRVHSNSWNGETWSKQGVALKNIGYTVIVGMVLLFNCV